MAAFNKFNTTVDALWGGTHVIGTSVYKLMLTNSPPAATNTILSQITEITPASGYAAGGPTVTLTKANSTGTETISASANAVVTAAATIGPFRYAVLYNSSAPTISGCLVGWWDYGSAVTLNSGDTFTWAPTGLAVCTTI